jgi:hypothetical protein
VVTDGNQDTVIDPHGFAEIGVNAAFNTGDFYIQEDGSWYAKYENCHSGADMEVYNAE